MAQLNQVLGGLLSNYDQTALDTVRQLSAETTDTASADAFLCEAAAVDALLKLLERASCDPTAVFAIARSLLEKASKQHRVPFVRRLVDKEPRRRIQQAMSRLTPATAQCCAAALDLLRTMVAVLPRAVFARFGRVVPLDHACFKDRLAFDEQPIRFHRTKLLLQYLLCRVSDISAAAMTQPFFMWKLFQDLPDLVRTGEAGQALCSQVLSAFATEAVDHPHVEPAIKRRLVQGQRDVLKATVAMLGHDTTSATAASLLRKLVVELVEPCCDYAVSKNEDDDTGLPNFLFLIMLRMLRPSHRAIDAHLVVFVLFHCPDLFRPYVVRVSRQIAEPGQSLSEERTFAAVSNVVCRVLSCPLPFYITSGAATLLEPGHNATRFYQLTPEAAANECCPPWLQRFVHRVLLFSHSAQRPTASLWTVFGLQIAHAAVARVASVKAALGDLQAADPAAWFAFNTELDAVLGARLPTKELLLQVTHRLRDEVAGPTGPRAEFALQRAFRVVALAAEVFNARQPLSDVVPAIKDRWAGAAGPLLLPWQPDTMWAFCNTVTVNLSRGVALPRLHHVNMDGRDDRPPLLLELLRWYKAHAATEAAPFGALLGIVRVLRHIVVLTVGAAVSDEEVAGWLHALPAEALPAFVIFVASCATNTRKAAGSLAEQIADFCSKAAAREKAYGGVWGGEVRRGLVALQGARPAAGSDLIERAQAQREAIAAANEEDGAGPARRGPRLLRGGEVSHLPLHAQVADFFAHRRAPLPPPEDEAFRRLSLVDGRDLLVQGFGAQAAPLSWAADATAVWDVCGRLRNEFTEHRGAIKDEAKDGEAKDGETKEEVTTLRPGAITPTAHALLRALRQCTAPLAEALVQGAVPELHAAGLALLHFLCVHHAVACGEVEEAELLQAHLLELYSGTLGVVDRILFAAVALLEPRPCTDEAKDDGSVLTTAPRHRSPLCIGALRRARFVIGSTAAAAGRVPEHEAMANVMDALVDEQVTEWALALPLRIATPCPEEATRPPLALIFPDAADRFPWKARGHRWYATGTAPLVDTVTTRFVDPRYFVPLFYSVAAARNQHLTHTPGLPLARALPVVLRCLSAVDAVLRGLATSCHALQHRHLHALPHLVSNAARLQMQRGSNKADIPRLAAPLSAFYVLALPVLGHGAHPMHRDVERALQYDSAAVPLDHFLAQFPASCVVGLPSLAASRHGKDTLVRTEQLQWLLRQLSASCAVWTDCAFLERRRVVPQLLVVAGLLQGHTDLRRDVLATVRRLVDCHADDVLYNGAVQQGLVQWALLQLAVLPTTVADRELEPLAMDVLSLLRVLYPAFRTHAVHHAQACSTLVALLRHAHAVKRLSPPLIRGALCIVACAVRAAGRDALTAADAAVVTAHSDVRLPEGEGAAGDAQLLEGLRAALGLRAAPVE